MPIKARKKAVDIEAVEFTGDNFGELADFGVVGLFEGVADDLFIWVAKSEAWCHVEVGDYIIQEVDDPSAFYPCANFNDLYDVLGSSNDG